MENFFSPFIVEKLFVPLLSGIVSGTVISALLGVLFHRRAKRIEEELKQEYAKSFTEFQSKRSWKEKSVAELLGPLYMQFERTNQAFKRWNELNLYLEGKVVMQSNLAIRDLLLTKSHLIPPDLRDDASKLVEHYDYWLEKYEEIRNKDKPDLEKPFVFVGPDGFPFPTESETKFKRKLEEIWNELYQSERN